MNSGPRLSVNLNKIALLRNARHTGVPDLLTFATVAREAGADGLTVHPRPDERHIRASDVTALADWMRPFRPAFELNIEGFPDERFLSIIKVVQPEQCTSVPDPPTAFTSDEGWKVDGSDRALLGGAITRFRRHCGRLILFMEPDPVAMRRTCSLGVDGVEIYTGSYAAEHRAQRSGAVLASCLEAAGVAAQSGLRINVGHDLNLRNIPPLIRALPPVAEASIGHELTADALAMGFGAAVSAYLAALRSVSEPLDV